MVPLSIVSIEKRLQLRSMNRALNEEDRQHGAVRRHALASTSDRQESKRQVGAEKTDRVKRSHANGARIRKSAPWGGAKTPGERKLP